MRLFRSRARFVAAGRVVVLKKDWKRKAREYARRSVFVIVPLVIFSLLALQSNFARANTTLYHPSSCLGDWEGVVHALGNPETPFGSDKFNLHEHNSAKFSGGKAKIFCGNFSGEDLRGANFQKAILSLHWGLIYEREYASAIVPSPSNSEPNQSSTTTTSSIETSSSTTTTTIPTSTPSGANPPSSTSTPPVPATSSVSFWNWWVNTAQAEEASISIAEFSPEPILVEATSTPSTSTPLQSGEEEVKSSQATSTKKSAEHLSDPTQFATGTIKENSSTHHLTPLTLEELSERLANASSVPISGEAEAETKKTLEIPFSLEDTDLKEEESVPVSLDANVITVGYSLDGENWKDLTLMHARDWHLAQYEIPVKNWDEVQDLQIRIAVTSNDQDPFVVFLDGMSLVVEYSPAPPEWFQRFIPKGEMKALLPEEPERAIYAPGAKHECTVEPFTQKVRGLEEAKFTVNLMPSDPAKIYTLSLGELPPGIEASFTQKSGTATSTLLVVKAKKEAQKGSFNLAIIYEEKDQAGAPIPNFCQLNLEVD